MQNRCRWFAYWLAAKQCPDNRITAKCRCSDQDASHSKEACFGHGLNDIARQSVRRRKTCFIHKRPNIATPGFGIAFQFVEFLDAVANLRVGVWPHIFPGLASRHSRGVEIPINAVILCDRTNLPFVEKSEMNRSSWHR